MFNSIIELLVRNITRLAIVTLGLALASFPRITLAQVGQLQTAIHELDRDPEMRAASWSMCVMDTRTGEVLLGHKMHKSLATASTMKVVTTATALAILGENYRFNTVLEYEGTLSPQGMLNGNLFIRGSGDPSLASHRLDDELQLDPLMANWAKMIKEAGITAINGQVIGDASYFDTQLTPEKWPWEDMGNYYGAGASGLNIHENFYKLDFRPGKTVGASTSILRTEPFMKNMKFINEVTTGSSRSGDNAYIFGAPYSTIRYVRGTIPGGRNLFTIKGSMPDPALFAARRLAEELRRCEVRIARAPTTLEREKAAQRPHTSSRTAIYSHYSLPLRAIVKETNQHSINLYAEALLKRIALKQGKKGTTAEGIESVLSYWKQQGVDTKGMLLRDGSGLSPNNVLSAYQLTRILYKAHQAPYREALVESLPIAGKQGSMKSIGRGTRAENNLRAKSGYISAVRAYTGYVKSKNGKWLAFTLIANNYTSSAGSMRRKMAKLMVLLAELNV